MIFILFMLGGILNSVVFAYQYGNLQPRMYSYHSNDFFYREYRVVFSYQDMEGGMVSVLPAQDYYITENDIEEIKQSGLFENIILSYVYVGNVNTENDSTPGRSVATCIYGAPNITRSSGKKTLSSDDQVLISIHESEKTGHTVWLGSKKFTVAGKYVGAQNLMITPEAYSEMKIMTNELFLTSVSRWHSGYSNEDPPADLLRELFPDARVLTPELSEMYIMRPEVNNYAIFTSGIVYFVCVIAFLFMLRYITDSLFDENAVSIISGARPIEIFSEVFCEGVLLSFVASVIGLIFHKIFYDAIFVKINMVDGILYTNRDYSIMLLLMLIIIVVCMIIFSLKYLRFSAARLQRMSKA